MKKRKKEAVINGKIEALSSEIWQDSKSHKLFFEYIDVSPEAEELIETLMEEKLKAAVIENIEEIKHLQNKSWVFLKNSEIPQHHLVQNDKKSILENRKIKNFIKMKDSGIPENIFENVYVVSNIKEALTYKKEFPNCCFLTKQGEVFFPDGFIKTGKKSNILQKKRLLEQLKEEKKMI